MAICSQELARSFARPTEIVYLNEFPLCISLASRSVTTLGKPTIERWWPSSTFYSCKRSSSDTMCVRIFYFIIHVKHFKVQSYRCDLKTFNVTNNYKTYVCTNWVCNVFIFLEHPCLWHVRETNKINCCKNLEIIHILLISDSLKSWYNKFNWNRTIISITKSQIIESTCRKSLCDRSSRGTVCVARPGYCQTLNGLTYEVLVKEI